MSDRADDGLLTRLRALFREELQDNLRVLSDGLAELRAGPGEAERGDLVHRLFRAAHSLKGAAHAAGVTEAVQPCQRLEDGLDGVRSGRVPVDEHLVATLAADVSALAELHIRLDRPALDAPPTAGRSLGARTTPARSHPVGAAAGTDDVLPAPPGPATTERGGPGGAPRARVAVAALDDLLQQAGSLLATSRRLHALSTTFPAASAAADEVADIDRELGRAAERVACSALDLRMLAFEEVTTGFDHVVANLASSTGKEVELVVRGGEVELDREITTVLREPLLHLIRNAVDHGIEPPDARRAAGKAGAGTVTITAAPAGNRVRITVADDGAGVDVDALRAIAADEALTVPDALEVAFRPGVSTAADVSDVSGRGVGLDAVRSRIEGVGGSIRIHTGDEPGRGTEVELVVPLTLAVARLLFVAVAEQVVALPTAAVRRMWRIDPDDLDAVGGRLLLRSEGEPRPVVPLAVALGFSAGTPPAAGQIALELEQEDGLLLVDTALGEEEGLLQPLPRRVDDPLALGAVIVGPDRAALVANPATCLRVGAGIAVAGDARPADRPRPTILLVEDTRTTRALERSILAGAGYRVLEAVDGADGWRLLVELGADLVVSDVDMPNLDGVELCRAIRSSARFRDLPVVLVSSLGDDDDRRRGVEAGADAYLVKSAFDQTALLDTVRRLL